MLERDIHDCEDAQPRWDAVWKHAVAAKALVDPDRRDYYQAAVLTMITINRESNRALLLVARALQDNAAGDTEKARNEAAELVAGARCGSSFDGRGRVWQMEKLVSR